MIVEDAVHARGKFSDVRVVQLWIIAERETDFAFESAQALAHVLKMIDAAQDETILIVNLSGRGDKDVYEVARVQGQTV